MDDQHAPQSTRLLRRLASFVLDPQSFVALAPEHAPFARSLGLDHPRAVLARTDGQPVGGHLGRSVVELQGEWAGRPVTVYLKRECHPGWNDRFANWRRGSGPVSKSWHEWTILRALVKAGIGCPEPLAVGAVPGLTTRAFLAVAALPCGVNLAEVVQGALRPAQRRRLAAALAREIARLHGAGFDHPDLFSKHVYVAETPDGGWRAWFLDFQSTRRRPKVAPATRWRDLAALDATLAPRRVSRSDRLRFLIAYVGQAGLAGSDPVFRERGHTRLTATLRQAIAAIGRRTTRLLGRRKVREMRSGQLSPPARARCIGRDDGRLCVVPDYLECLDRAGLARFEDVMTTRRGRVLRELKDRANLVLDLARDDSSGPTRAYLKRHRTAQPWEWLRARIGHTRFVSPGRAEAMNIWRIERAGVPAMRLIAYGERFRGGWHSESFVLTEEVAQATPLDAFLRRRFAGPVDPSSRRDLRRLIHAVAEVARRFHAAGYNHRDLYCCHFLIRQTAAGRFAVHLIDLQRVQYRRRFRARWLIKDLAQLNYSAPAEVIGCTDRLRFLKTYLGVRRLGRAERRLARRVVFKTRLIARRGIAP